MFHRHLLLWLALLTLFVFSGVGYALIIWQQERNWQQLLGNQYALQVSAGFAFGLMSAIVAVVLVESRYLGQLSDFFRELFRNSDIRWHDAIFASFCAGIGEEIFFRGALQYYLGIWGTAILFVLIHGYLNPKHRNLFLYGLYMIFVSAGFGYLCQYSGLLSAIVAHIIFDIYMFWHLLCSRTK